MSEKELLSLPEKKVNYAEEPQSDRSGETTGWRTWPNWVNISAQIILFGAVIAVTDPEFHYRVVVFDESSREKTRTNWRTIPI